MPLMSAKTGSAPQVGEVQRGGAVGERDRVLAAQVLGEDLLELLRTRAHGQPARAQRVRHGVEVGLLELDVEQWDQGGVAHQPMFE